MIEIDDKSKCCGCYACFNICPKNAITMCEDEYGFKYPKIDKNKCINCGLCEQVCPTKNKNEIENEPKAYASYNLDEEIRMQSSSGGIFSLIAESILEENGIVFGAKFNEKFEVEHDFIERKEELYKFRGSKYVQSSIGVTYKKAKEFLEKDRYVLFTGTPCQVEGLKAYLKKDYDKLYTQDIICHGVPSPKIWKKYLEYRKKQDKEEPVQINFRQKDFGWNLFALLLQYNNSAYKINHNDDLFMQAFLRNTILRDSCYACNFKKKNRISDITLADFWGIHKILPDMNDNKGISLVIINSEKGNKIFEKIKDKIKYEKINLEEAINFNQSMICSVKKPKHRKEFFENITEENFENSVKKYTKIEKPNILRRIYRKIKKNINKKR